MTICTINVSVPTLETDGFYKRVTLNPYPIVVSLDGNEDPAELIKDNDLDDGGAVEEAVRNIIKTPLLWDKAVLMMRTIWKDGSFSDITARVADIFTNKPQ